MVEGTKLAQFRPRRAEEFDLGDVLWPTGCVLHRDQVVKARHEVCLSSDTEPGAPRRFVVASQASISWVCCRGGIDLGGQWLWARRVQAFAGCSMSPRQQVGVDGVRAGPGSCRRAPSFGNRCRVGITNPRGRLPPAGRPSQRLTPRATPRSSRGARHTGRRRRQPRGQARRRFAQRAR